MLFVLFAEYSLDMCIADGYEATAELRALGVQTPIVALTGNALDEDQVRFIQAGAVTVLTKPVRREHVAQALRQFTRWVPNE